VDSVEHGVLMDDDKIEAAQARGLPLIGTFPILDHPAGIEVGYMKTPNIVVVHRRGAPLATD
jgi:imidazolonepropionase-like amidohydrolase